MRKKIVIALTAAATALAVWAPVAAAGSNWQ